MKATMWVVVRHSRADGSETMISAHPDEEAAGNQKRAYNRVFKEKGIKEYYFEVHQIDADSGL